MSKAYDMSPEQDGYFEGVYDYIPDLAVTADAQSIHSYIPRISRWDLSSARPAIFGFREGLDKAVPKLSFPYRTTNILSQIGLQYDDTFRAGSVVPDAYAIRYSRCGTTVGGHDQTKSLTVDILSAELAETYAAEEEAVEQSHRRWQNVARAGRKVGNAVLAYQTVVSSYDPVTPFGSTTKYSELKPVDDTLAEAAFTTVLYWH